MSKITIMENGPYLIEIQENGTLKKGGQEETINQKIVALCRCGHSAKKPFCDGGHKECGFQSEAGELTLN